MAAKLRITHARLREVLSYDPETGIFTNLIDRGPIKAGTQVGGLSTQGYVQFMMDGAMLLGHMAAWFYMTGKWSDKKIDHMNCVRDDNRWKNIRQATDQENTYNRNIQSNNKSGFKGVAYFKGPWNKNKPWCAEIRANKKRVWMKYFATPEEAHEARTAALYQFHGEFAKT